MEKRTPLIIDTDPGIDDAAAIFWILASKTFDVKALTITHGNVGMEKCSENALRLLEYAGRTDIPVYRGASGPILRARISAEFAHGSDGMGDSGLPLPVGVCGEGHAANRMVDLAKACGEPVTILAIGPVTNIALAVLLEPDLKEYVRQIVFMGGAVHVPGNISPWASFNVAADPEAARIVYRSGIPVAQVGLDVCNRFSFSRSDFETMEREGGSMARILCRMARFRLDKIGGMKEGSVAREDGIALNDVAAAAYLVNPGWFTTRMASGDIVTDGPSAGQTQLDFDIENEDEANICFVSDADTRAAISRWVECLGNAT